MFGNLSEEKLVLDTRPFYRNEKTLQGVVLFFWINSITDEERSKYFKFVADDLKNGGKIFGTKVIKTIGFNEIFD